MFVRVFGESRAQIADAFEIFVDFVVAQGKRLFWEFDAEIGAVHDLRDEFRAFVFVFEFVRDFADADFEFGNFVFERLVMRLFRE
jgi:hypothetical protein